MQRTDGRTQVRERILSWSKRLGVTPKVIRIRRMTRKWGSCSSKGVISLASDLAEKPSQFQDFVIVHELLHLRVSTHGRLFKALMTAHVPGWRELDVDR
jgi:predicted metal-dependent hydrolase